MLWPYILMNVNQHQIGMTDPAKGVPLALSRNQYEREISSLLRCNTPSAVPPRSAAGLFCWVANPQQEYGRTDYGAKCDASRTDLMKLFSQMRKTVNDDSVFVQAVQAAKSSDTLRVGRHENLKLWIPAGDKGVNQVLNELQRGEYGEFFNLLLGEDGSVPLFVDGGANLGFVSLLTALETDATIVAVEAASPTWVMNSLNFICNIPSERLATVHSVFAALGDADDQILHLHWRPESTITVRGWDSHVREQVRFTVPVHTLRTVLAATVGGDHPMKIDVLKIDCEGCEYNVIPDLTEEEFNSVHTMIGEIHYGFIPTDRAPSKQRAKTTHQRLCRHSNFVQFAKECCMFPNEKILHENIPIREAPGYASLCGDFAQWSGKGQLEVFLRLVFAIG